MKQINFETSSYNHKEELKTFVHSLNELIDKYNKGFENKGSRVQKLETSITRKKNALEKLLKAKEELNKREEELISLKKATSEDIRELEAKKKAIDYTDSEVQKMEKEDIDILIASKKTKIEKIDTKAVSTKAKIKNNEETQKISLDEIKALELAKKEEEESLYKTEAILKLTNSTKEAFNASLQNILNNKYEDDFVDEEYEEPIYSADENEVLDFSVEDYKLQDMEEKPLEINEPVINIDNINNFEPVDLTIKEEPVEDTHVEVVNDVKEVKEEVPVVEDVTMGETNEIPIEDLDTIELPQENLPEAKEYTSEDTDYKTIIEDTFNKEGLSYDSFDEETQIKLVENAERVLKNMIVLKKHRIPLDLTINQSEIYYNISPQDLEDLLNIITTDEDGNGMGFDIDFTFYILNELSKVNVDKLIEVYNSEFMNITAKSGLINLIKKTNDTLTDFKNNRKMNEDTLTSLGVANVDEIGRNYPEFVNMDNPLFLNALNLFDKDDLVSKINSDNKIIPKIVEYWKNN